MSLVGCRCIIESLRNSCITHRICRWNNLVLFVSYVVINRWGRHLLGQFFCQYPCPFLHSTGNRVFNKSIAVFLLIKKRNCFAIINRTCFGVGTVTGASVGTYVSSLHISGCKGGNEVTHCTGNRTDGRSANIHSLLFRASRVFDVVKRIFLPKHSYSVIGTGVAVIRGVGGSIRSKIDRGLRDNFTCNNCHNNSPL